jgi:hypothetical protein
MEDLMDPIAITPISDPSHSNPDGRRFWSQFRNISEVRLKAGVVDEPQVTGTQFQSTHHPEPGPHGKRHRPRPTTLDPEENLR